MLAQEFSELPVGARFLGGGQGVPNGRVVEGLAAGFLKFLTSGQRKGGLLGWVWPVRNQRQVVPAFEVEAGKIGLFGGGGAGREGREQVEARRGGRFRRQGKGRGEVLRRRVFPILLVFRTGCTRGAS